MKNQGKIDIDYVVQKIKISCFINEKYIYNESLNEYLILKFMTVEYCIVLIFDLIIYFKSMLLYILFNFCYWLDIKVFSIIKNLIIMHVDESIIVYIKIVLYYFIYNKIIILFFIILFIILHYLILVNFNFELFCKFLEKFIYQRLNFILNLYFFLYLYQITLEDYIDYSFVIIIIFIVFWFYRVITLIFQKELEVGKIYHFLNFPFISLIIWIILFFKLNKLKFLNILLFYLESEIDTNYFKYECKLSENIIKNE